MVCRRALVALGTALTLVCTWVLPLHRAAAPLRAQLCGHPPRDSWATEGERAVVLAMEHALREGDVANAIVALLAGGDQFARGPAATEHLLADLERVVAHMRAYFAPKVPAEASRPPPRARAPHSGHVPDEPLSAV